MNSPSVNPTGGSAPQAPPPTDPTVPPSPTAAPSTKMTNKYAGIALAGVLALTIIALVSWWAIERANTSITDDAFIEAHVVNIAPQSVSGHLVRFLVEENDRVEQGQLLAEVDPIAYRDQVDLARSKVDGARAELKRQEAAWSRGKLEVPIQIELARRSFAAAQADQAKAKEALKLTIDSVDKGIAEARAGLDAAAADLVLAQQEYERFTNLSKQEAVPLRRSQEVTRSRDAADAQRKLARAKLETAQAERTQIEVA